MVRVELFSQILSKEDYFKSWESEKIAQLTDAIKERIYQKYVVKCHVFSRDGFKCQNTHCVTAASPITVHHVKAQRNGGENKPENLITVCDSCHKRYERARGPLTFSKDAAHLPKRMRGHTFQLFKPAKYDARWKKVKKILKRFRKLLRREGYGVTFEQYLDKEKIDLDTREVIFIISQVR